MGPLVRDERLILQQFGEERRAGHGWLRLIGWTRMLVSLGTLLSRGMESSHDVVWSNGVGRR